MRLLPWEARRGRETGNYPMHRYIKRSELSDELLGRVGSWLGKNMYADISEYAPADDDTNYTVLYQELIEKYGRDFTSKNVADIWLDRQPKNAYCILQLRQGLYAARVRRI